MKSDPEIQRDIERELRSRPHTDAMDVAVHVHDGIARLTGFACSYCEKYRAEDVARAVTGVAGVLNDVEIHLTSAEHLSDDELRCAANRALQTEVPALRDKVKVLVDRGEITLEGSVSWHFLRERAESALRRLPGVTVVHNAIAIEPAALSREIERRISSALPPDASAAPSKVSVETNGSEVTLRGHVKSAAEWLLAEQTAWSVHGVTGVTNCIAAPPGDR